MNQTSQGASLDASFVFELGAFRPGFIPTWSNREAWTANWTGAQRVKYSVQTKYAAGEWILENNEGAFATSNRGYIWGYNVDGASSEWVLLGDARWTWPDASDFSLPLAWRCAAAREVIAGEVKADGSPFFLKTASVGSLPPPVTSSARWQQIHGTENWQGDPDGDGLSNLLEMAFGGDPAKPEADLTELPQAEEIRLGDQAYWQCRFSKQCDCLLQYRAEVSTDQVNWRALQPEDIFSEGLDEVIYREPAGETHRLFMRLTVQVP